MAAKVGLTVEEFERRFTRSINGRRSLNERETSHGFDCTFLDRTVKGRATCRLYEARPTQCRTWPFWPENLASPAAWNRAKKATPCLGMDNGPIIPIESIRIQRDLDRFDNADKPF